MPNGLECPRYSQRRWWPASAVDHFSVDRAVQYLPGNLQRKPPSRKQDCVGLRDPADDGPGHQLPRRCRGGRELSAGADLFLSGSGFTYKLLGLQSGLVFNSALGQITGRYNGAASTTIQITGTNAYGSEVKVVNLIATLGAPIPGVTGTVKVPFSFSAAMSGATSYTATGLPSGLTGNATTGLISAPQRGGQRLDHRDGDQLQRDGKIPGALDDQVTGGIRLKTSQSIA